MGLTPRWLLGDVLPRLVCTKYAACCVSCPWGVADYSTLIAALEAKPAAFNATAEDACLARLQATACAMLAGPEFVRDPDSFARFCPEAFPVRSEPAGECLLNVNCPGGFCSGACREGTAEGGDCEFETCAPGLFCDHAAPGAQPALGLCVQPWSDGSTCSCFGGAGCFDSKCVGGWCAGGACSSVPTAGLSGS